MLDSIYLMLTRECPWLAVVLEALQVAPCSLLSLGQEPLYRSKPSCEYWIKCRRRMLSYIDMACGTWRTAVQMLQRCVSPLNVLNASWSKTSVGSPHTVMLMV